MLEFYSFFFFLSSFKLLFLSGVMFDASHFICGCDSLPRGNVYEKCQNKGETVFHWSAIFGSTDVKDRNYNSDIFWGNIAI